MGMRLEAAEAALKPLQEEDGQVTAQDAIGGVVRCAGCELWLLQVFTAALRKQHQRGWTWDLAEGNSTIATPPRGLDPILMNRKQHALLF